MSQNLTKGWKEHDALLKTQMSLFKKDQLEPLLKELRERLPDKSLSSDRVVSAVREVVSQELKEGFVAHARSLAATPTVGASPGVTAVGTPGGGEMSLAELQRQVREELLS
jgi:hypothetical protein